MGCGERRVQRTPEREMERRVQREKLAMKVPRMGDGR